MNEILALILLTLTPFLELRASIPYGVFNTELSLLSIFLIVVTVNIILAPLLFLFLKYFVGFFLQMKFIDKIYQKTVVRTQHKVHRYVEKYGILGLAIFIGIPLPGSGVYSGALAAYILGFRFRDFFRAAVMGVVIAAVIVTLISVAGDGAWQVLLKQV
jgi:uncharacterized membrane protein